MAFAKTKTFGGLTIKLDDGKVIKNGEQVFKGGIVTIFIEGSIPAETIMAATSKVTGVQSTVVPVKDSLKLVIRHGAVHFPEDAKDIFDVFCSDLERVMRNIRQAQKAAAKPPKTPGKDTPNQRRRHRVVTA